jgi:hypothetical protein
MDKERIYKILYVDNDCCNATLVRQQLSAITVFQHRIIGVRGIKEALWMLESIPIDYLIINICAPQTVAVEDLTPLYDRKGTALALVIGDADARSDMAVCAEREADRYLSAARISTDLLSNELVRLRMIRDSHKRSTPGNGKADIFAFDPTVPITSVIGLSEIMSRYVHSASLRDETGESAFGADEARPFSEDILLGSMLEATSLKPDYTFVELRPFLQDLVRSDNRSSADGPSRVRLTITPDLPAVVVQDQKKMHKILNSLLSAARLSSESASIALLARGRLNDDAQTDLSIHITVEGPDLRWPDSPAESVWDPDDDRPEVAAIRLRTRIARRIADVLNGSVSVTRSSETSLRILVLFPGLAATDSHAHGDGSFTTRPGQPHLREVSVLPASAAPDSPSLEEREDVLELSEGSC